MIDSKLISIIELKESVQILDVYSNKLYRELFNFFYIINQYESKYFFVEFFFKIFYFLQFFFIAIIWIPSKDIESDFLLDFISKLKKYMFVQDLVNNKSKYIFALLICFIFPIIIFLLVIYIIKNKEKANKSIIILYNYLNHIFINYFFCFQINILLIPINCQNSKVFFLEIKCYTTIPHILLFIYSITNIILDICYLFIVSKFIGTIANMKGMNIYSKTNNNYDIFANIFCTFCYIFGHFIVVYGEKETSIRIIVRIIFMIGCFFISIYLHKKVYFYNENMNTLYLCGWTFLMWFYLALSIKEILNFEEVLLFVIFGWILLGSIFYLYKKVYKERYLFKINVFEAVYIKDIEIFVQNIFKLLNREENENSKLILRGLLNSFEDYFSDKPQLKEIYDKFINNKFLNKKYGGKGNIVFETYALIYVLLNSILDKLKDDALLVLCAFLINILKNYNFAMYLCSKHKILGYYNSYIKYSLIQDAKNMIISKLDDLSNLDNINKVQIGSVLLYIKQCEKLKLRIYDATCQQGDYFDILKNNNISDKIVVNFLHIGNIILKYRKEILECWDIIITLNPFNEEIKRDYMLYLENIIQDEELAQKEETKLNRYKNAKIINKDKIYYTLFETNTTSILLVDGYSNKEKVLYVTPNFFTLFNYFQKDINSLKIHDLIPKYIASFHKEIINDALKYSNLKRIYKKPKNLLLKGKNNEIYDVEGFFKIIPDLSYGYNYIGMIEKIKDKEFLIILDNEFNIDSMTTLYCNSEIGNILFNRENYPFGLTNKIIGNHISIIIPSIIPLFKIQNSKYFIKKLNTDFKGHLYTNFNDILSFHKKIKIIFDKMKQGEKLNFCLESKFTSSKNQSQFSFKEKNSVVNKNNDYINLIEEYNKIFKNDFYYITYKITKHSFINEKYCYYRIYINRDIYSEFETQDKKSTLTNKNQPSSTIFQSFNNEFKIDNYNKEHQIKIESEVKLKDSSPKNKKKNSNEKSEEKEKSIIEKEQLINKNSQSNYSKTHTINLYYQDMKAKIINKENPYYIIIMRILFLIFSISSIFLIIYNNNSMKIKFKLIHNYLDQNYVFNHTKVAILNLYFTMINIKALKYNIMGNDGCISTNYCLNNMHDIMIREINNINISIEKILKLNNDYLKIVKSEINLEIYGMEFDNKTNYKGNIGDVLYLILTLTKKLVSNLDEFISGSNNYYNIYVESIIKYCILYLKLEESDGLDDYQKRKNASRPEFSSNKIYLIFNLIIFLFIFVGLYFFVMKFYQIEIGFIKKILKFNCPSFDKYIKYLGGLKKKLKIDSNEDNISVNNSDNSELTELKGTNIKKSIFKTKIEGEKINKNENNKKNSKKKKNSKLERFNHQKKEKMKVMKNHFFIYNSLFSINICVLCFIIMSYYMLVYLLYIYRKNSYFIYDDFMASVEGIYLKAYLAFSILKNQTNHYTDFEILKNISLYQLNNNYSSVTFLNEIYTKDNYTILENQKYIFYIPNENERKITKLGTLITSYTTNVDISVNSTKTVLVNLYNGNACDVLFNIYYINSKKYYECIIFWSGFITQGIEQCIAELDIEILNIVTIFELINNRHNVLENYNILDTLYNNCELFIINYFYYAYKITQILFIDLEEDIIDLIFFTFDIIVYSYVIGCILVFIIFNILIYLGGIKFADLINFIIIFPMQYLIEEENLYSEIIDVYKLIYE